MIRSTGYTGPVSARTRCDLGRQEDDVMDRSSKRGFAVGGALLALCCGLPALLVALGVTAAAGVAAACSSWGAAVVLLVVALGFGARWWVTRRRGPSARRGTTAANRPS